MLKTPKDVRLTGARGVKQVRTHELIFACRRSHFADAEGGWLKMSNSADVLYQAWVQDKMFGVVLASEASRLCAFTPQPVQ